MIRNRRSAFTMIEMIISMSIIAFFVIAVAFSINKREQQRIGQPIGGTYICYKDANNALHSRTEIRYENTTEVTENSGESCVFELPQSVNNYTLTLIGGGGGAGAPSVLAPDIVYDETENSINTPFSCVGDSVDSSYSQREYCDTEDGCRFLAAASTPDVDIITNHLSNIMTDNVYESLFLTGINVTVSGGNDMYNGAGANCSVTRNFRIGEEILCINGASEIGTDVYAGLADGNWTSSTKGLLKVDNSELIKAQGKVSYNGYSTIGSNFNLTPSCVAGIMTNNPRGIGYNARRYTSSVIDSISLRKGLAGSAGEYVIRLNQTASSLGVDGVVTIEADKIGNGGAAAEVGAGTRGGETRFELIGLGEVMASGGAGGADTETACRLFDSVDDMEDIKINIMALSGREHPELECYAEGDRARVSAYVRERLFPLMSNEAQEFYMSQSGYCDERCEDAQVAEKISYGNGGSAGAVRVIYDYIRQFTLFDNAGNELDSTPLTEPEFEYSAGANGSGGAIIISW